MKSENLSAIADMYDAVFVNTVDQVDITSNKIYILPHSKAAFKFLSQNCVSVELLRFRLLTTSRPRLLVRLDRRDFYVLALNFFSPGSTLAKLYLSLMRLLSVVRLMPSTGTSDYLVATSRTKSSVIPDLIPADLIALYIGTAEPCRKLVALMKNGHRGNIVVKGSTDPKSAQAIDKEFDAMKRVKLLGFEKYLPELKYYKKYDNGLTLLVTEAVAISQPNTNLTKKLLLEFLTNFNRLSPSTIPIENWLNALDQHIGARALKDHRQILATIVVSMPRLPIRISHGDLSVWNILLKDQEIKIIDWEEFTEDIIFADLFQFHYSKWLCSKKSSVLTKVILDEIYKDATILAENELTYRNFLTYLYLWLTSRSIDQDYSDILVRIVTTNIYASEDGK